jgi:hypothetical protein
MESIKIWEMRKKSLTSLQKEFVVGTLLGDGCILSTTRGYCLRIHHGVKQKKYVEWKYRLMKNLVNTSPKLCQRGYYFRTVSNPIFDKYRQMFYEGKKKKIPYNLRNLLTSLGLAVWIMDDGSRDKGCIRISTHSFSYLDHLKLQKTLRAKFGIKSSIQKAKDKFWLWIKSESIPSLVERIKPYFISNMLYKLPRNDLSRNRDGWQFKKLP